MLNFVNGLEASVNIFFTTKTRDACSIHHVRLLNILFHDEYIQIWLGTTSGQFPQKIILPLDQTMNIKIINYLQRLYHRL